MEGNYDGDAEAFPIWLIPLHPFDTKSNQAAVDCWACNQLIRTPNQAVCLDPHTCTKPGNGSTVMSDSDRRDQTTPGILWTAHSVSQRTTDRCNEKYQSLHPPLPQGHRLIKQWQASEKAWTTLKLVPGQSKLETLHSAGRWEPFYRNAYYRRLPALQCILPLRIPDHQNDRIFHKIPHSTSSQVKTWLQDSLDLCLFLLLPWK